MISRLLVKAALVGFAASVAVAAPAAAAPPTLISTPATAVGFSQVTLSGVATPNATVELYETAYVFDDLQPALNWEVDNQPIKLKADAQGKYSVRRWIDSGFYFQTRVGSDRSNKLQVSVKQVPDFLGALTSTTNNTVTAQIIASPGQPGLTAELQQQINGVWVKVGQGITQEAALPERPGGVASITATGVSGGSGTFRAFMNGDDKNAVLDGAGATRTLNVQGPVTNPPSTTPPTTPPTTTPTPKPTTTTPTPKPTTTTPTPKPTTPKPTVPAVGSVQFTRIQYDSPGTDSGSNGSLNTEWAKLTNKTKAAINLKDWTVRDSGNHVYKFSGNVVLGAGQSIFVITGKGTNSATKKYWGRKGTAGYIWNNDREVGYLRTPTGRQIDTCIWYSRGTGATNC